MEQIAVISSPPVSEGRWGGVDSIGGIPTFTKTMILYINISWSFFFGFGTQKTCTKKTSNTWVILCDGAEIAAENSHALKQETSIWHRAIHGSAGIKGFIGKSNLIQRASTFFVGLEKEAVSSLKTSNPTRFFPAREPWETLFFSTKKQTKCYPSRFLSRFHSSFRCPSKDMLVSTRLTPSQRWTLLESSKRSWFWCFFFVGVFQSLFWNNVF